MKKILRIHKLIGVHCLKDTKLLKTQSSLTITKKMAACTFYQNALRASRAKDDTKSRNDAKF